MTTTGLFEHNDVRALGELRSAIHEPLSVELSVGGCDGSVAREAILPLRIFFHAHLHEKAHEDSLRFVDHVLYYSYK
jgi:hypothetical protein